jgi:hypothetical protein
VNASDEAEKVLGTREAIEGLHRLLRGREPVLGTPMQFVVDFDRNQPTPMLEGEVRQSYVRGALPPLLTQIAWAYKFADPHAVVASV